MQYILTEEEYNNLNEKNIDNKEAADKAYGEHLDFMHVIMAISNINEISDSKRCCLALSHLSSILCDYHQSGDDTLLEGIERRVW